MAREHVPRNKRRVARMLRMIRRLRSAEQPVAYRRNRVTLLPDGPRFFQSLFAAIRSARSTILLEYYLIRNDRTGTALADELADAVRRGVRVLLIYDYIGCIETPSNYFKALNQRGIELLPFNVPSFKRGIHWFDKRDHRKMALIDGTLAFLGGFNIGDEYAGLTAPPDSFRDLGFSVSGSAVRGLELIFLETWGMERNEELVLPMMRDDEQSRRRRGQATIVPVSGGPHHRRSYIRNAYLAAIASSSEDVLIATPYFVPGPRIVRSLLRAVRRGARVRLLLPAKSDVPLVRLVGHSYYTPLLKAGIEIYELGAQILHAKVMLIDGERTVIGSANLDQRSFHRNFEINAIIDNRTFGGQIRAVLEADIRNSRQITLEDHERRGGVARLVEKIVNLFGWFL